MMQSCCGGFGTASTDNHFQFFVPRKPAFGNLACLAPEAAEKL
jgi:hypothetical protein